MAGATGIPSHVFFRNGDNGWTLISETGIAGDYVASHLTGKDGGEYQIAYAQTGEQNGFGSTGAAIALPGYTPMAHGDCRRDAGSDSGDHGAFRCRGAAL